MKIIGPRAFFAGVLVVIISACSQSPEGLTTPTLAPQFGTADDDIGIDVATSSTDTVYVLSRQFGSNYPDEYNDTVNRQLLNRYDKSGNVIWTRVFALDRCEDDWYYTGCTIVRAKAVYTDASGSVYALASFYYPSEPDGLGPDLTYRLYKYDAVGNRVWERVLSYSEQFTNHPVSLAFDSNDNIFVAVGQLSEETSSSVSKYSNAGTLLWRRTSTVGTPADITVSPSGSVYVVGGRGMARYSNSGNISWTKPGNFEKVIVSGSYLYTRYRKDIRKYDGTGKQLWVRTQSGLNTLVLQDIDGDGNGNVYLSGKYLPSSASKMSAMVRKLNASGSVVWTKTYGTPAYDDALGIATLTGSEIYTTGETQGSLAHTNRGGRDGYLRKLNSSGSPIWMR